MLGFLRLSVLYLDSPQGETIPAASIPQMLGVKFDDIDDFLRPSVSDS